MSDQVAAARDMDAGRRHMAANVHARLTGDEHPEEFMARQAALDDRLHAKGDQDSSAIDRSVLAVIAEDDDAQQ